MFKSIYIEITNVCNLTCSFCKGSSRKKEFMNSKSFEEVLNKIKDYTNYIYLHLLGEPLMHPELEKILKLAADYNIKVNITTNGRLLEKKLNIINNSKSIRQINISLHSFNDIEEISNLLDTIDKIKIDCYISLRLWNKGVSNNNDKIIDLLNQHYDVEITPTENNYKLKDKVFLDFDNQFKWPDIEDEDINYTGTCYGLRTHIGILVDGTVVPCCLDTDGVINLGNIFKEDLGVILNSQRCKEMRTGFLNRKLTEPLCKRCQFIT
ncbi:MAG: radical SAM protein [Bacilli bacterium]|nr:radical SAM protein [Bacilli bacterium]MDD3304744.1 radical SAM protein [Bacilli bacterium]MDD4054113.1 radical SAM protein [Bacilli bacterium]MDD4411449.1 radical SAM protein [Bacilli bacterium]